MFRRRTVLLAIHLFVLDSAIVTGLFLGRAKGLVLTVASVDLILCPLILLSMHVFSYDNPSLIFRS